jgi:TM2 domain-containing membrane protein YozV
MESHVNIWLGMNANNFRYRDILVIKGKLEKMDVNQFLIVQSTSFENPSTILLIAIILGWERFWLDDILLGILKIITCHGFGIWWLIDIFTAKERAKKYNFRKFMRLTAFI